MPNKKNSFPIPFMRKILKTSSLLILFFLQLFCLIAIFSEFPQNLPALFLIFVTGLLISIGILRISKHSSNNSYNSLMLVIYTTFGAIITYILAVELNTGAVFASALVGTLSSFIPSFNKNSESLIEIPKAIYCGSFAGMTATFISQGYLFIILAGIATGVLYVMSKNTFIGVGGKLGTMAFGGVLLVFLLFIYIK